MNWPWNRKKKALELLKKGAKVIDVRTAGEFASGSVPGSINIPLDQISKSNKLPSKETPVVACCASGMRSGAASAQLRAMGYEVVNGGSWFKVANMQDEL